MQFIPPSAFQPFEEKYMSKTGSQTDVGPAGRLQADRNLHVVGLHSGRSQSVVGAPHAKKKCELFVRQPSQLCASLNRAISRLLSSSCQPLSNLCQTLSRHSQSCLRPCQPLSGIASKQMGHSSSSLIHCDDDTSQACAVALLRAGHSPAALVHCSDISNPTCAVQVLKSGKSPASIIHCD